ncbi:protein of unknown function [Cupriavidus taiwanensis]|uniref:Uncharacterized protein n=1 Tax=Cupriavidus taiwanensis TaxID=164546 RepID=A0A375FXW4_9BURK|nr:hypothetical protein CBM2585_A160351 [Cupriavidus taiwanensis]SOY89303.1 protein of unknown function [Cupriavidus taiwanensis]SOZ06571.1 hypothetical protein CBM2595_A81256 [Cupriavidus taiwanensis]SPC11362.1 hypothetical protein CT19431_40061 [Cupriavidus taiwanensis]SPC20089.1 hypothetical protein CBM2594_A90022 [Cupriavidus taiwanensis]
MEKSVPAQSGGPAALIYAHAPETALPLGENHHPPVRARLRASFIISVILKDSRCSHARS